DAFGLRGPYERAPIQESCPRKLHECLARTRRRVCAQLPNMWPQARFDKPPRTGSDKSCQQVRIRVAAVEKDARQMIKFLQGALDGHPIAR
ncbi:hypothetical protein SB751_30975, partial [Cupriavidus sp. SIMBA_020]|uniref:hypothetical protein n=1 Tax=Cupriavidus sp. SIMBA_020 TaxID=3085766 RepID=UPI00397CA23A